MFEYPTRIPSPGRADQATAWDYLGELEAMAEWLTTGPDASPALIEAVSGMDTFRGPETVTRWIHNVASARSRRQGRHGPTAARLDEIVSRGRRHGPTLAVSRDEIDLRLELLEALCCIPDNYRCALLLKEGAGLTVDTAARVMGVSTASLRSILYRARRALSG